MNTNENEISLHGKEMSLVPYKDQLWTVSQNLGQVLYRVADFGLFGINTDFLEEFKKLKDAMQKIGLQTPVSLLDTIIIKIERLSDIQALENKKNAPELYELFTLLVQLGNWHQLFQKHVKLLFLSKNLVENTVDMENREIKASLEVWEDQNLVITPLSIVPSIVTQEKEITTLDLKWLVIAQKDRKHAPQTLATFSESITTFRSLGDVNHIEINHNSSFFNGEIIHYRNQIRDQSLFKNIGFTNMTNPMFPDGLLRLKPLLKTRFFTKQKVDLSYYKELFGKTHYLTSIIIERQTSLEALLNANAITFKSTEMTVFTNNSLTLKQLLLRQFYGAQTYLLLMSSKHYASLFKVLTPTLAAGQQFFHILSVICDSVFSIPAIQQFSLTVRYSYIFDKLVLTSKKTITSFVDCYYITLLLNLCKIPSSNPIVQSLIHQVAEFVMYKFSPDELKKLIANPNELVRFIFIVDSFNLFTTKKRYSDLYMSILALKKRDISKNNWKVYIQCLLLLYSYMASLFIIDDTHIISQSSFLSYYRTRVGSNEKMAIQIIENKESKENIEVLKNEWLFSTRKTFKKYKEQGMDKGELAKKDLLEVTSLLIKHEVLNKPILEDLMLQEVLRVNLAWQVVQQHTEKREKLENFSDLELYYALYADFKKN